MNLKENHFQISVSTERVLEYRRIKPEVSAWCIEHGGDQYYDWGFFGGNNDTVFWFAKLEHAILFKMTWG